MFTVTVEQNNLSLGSCTRMPACLFHSLVMNSYLSCGWPLGQIARQEVLLFPAWPCHRLFAEKTCWALKTDPIKLP